MKTTRIVLLGAGVLLVLALLFVAVFAFVPLEAESEVNESSDSGFREAELANFDVTEPYCGDPNRRSGSSLTTPHRGRGETIVLNDTMRVAGPDSDVAAFVDTWGARRHTLKLEREPGNATGDCDYEVRYYATVSIPTDDYTLLVTADGELIDGYWREGSGGGSFSGFSRWTPPNSTSGTAATPTPNGSRTATATETATATAGS